MAAAAAATGDDDAACTSVSCRNGCHAKHVIVPARGRRVPLGLALTLITFLSASSVKVDVAWTCADISQVECLKHFEVGDGCGDWHLWCESDPIPDLGFSDEDNTVRVPIYWSGK